MEIVKKEETVQAVSALQQVFALLDQNFTLKMASSYEVTPQNFNTIIQMEVNRIRKKYNVEEEKYAEHMLAKNPIVVQQRRKPSPDEPEAPKSELQLQRADACRKSRLKSKALKAMKKHKLDFIKAKLQTTSTIYACTQDIILQVENKLIRSGLQEKSIAVLREAMGMGARMSGSM